MTEYCFNKKWTDINVSLNVRGTPHRLQYIINYFVAIYFGHIHRIHSMKIFSNLMKGDRLDAILHYLHFNAADDCNKRDKFAKPQLLMSHLQKKKKKNYEVFRSNAKYFR